MNDPTVSESLFERFCADRGLAFERVPEAEGRRPDYRLFINEIFIIVELKQFDPNKEEAKANQALELGEVVVGSAGKPGNRVRNAIRDAGPQLRALAQDIHPTLLVLYNNVPVVGHTGDYSVRVGMFGLETLNFEVPRDYDGLPRLVGRKFGPRRMTTPSHNTTISAIGVLAEERIMAPRRAPLSVYHNPYAAVPLPIALLRYVEGIAQFECPISDESDFVDWRQIDA